MMSQKWSTETVTIYIIHLITSVLSGFLFIICTLILFAWVIFFLSVTYFHYNFQNGRRYGQGWIQGWLAGWYQPVKFLCRKILIMFFQLTPITSISSSSETVRHAIKRARLRALLFSGWLKKISYLGWKT